MPVDPTSLFPQSTIKEPTRDASMTVRTAIRQQLISEEIALELCKMVIARWRGEDECKAQLPFTVEDGGNVWKVTGSRVLNKPWNPGDPAPIRMSISKLDAAIVSFFG
jgi:hypothetical protein